MPTSIKDLLNDVKLTLHVKTQAQQAAVDYAQSIAKIYDSQGYKIINTGHSLGGNEAQAATIALKDQGIDSVSAVVFNSPGIGGFEHQQSLDSYNVVNFYAQGDAIHLAGGDHVGTAVKIEAGPDSTDYSIPAPLVALGLVGGIVIAGKTLWNLVGPAHSIDTIASYLKWENPQFGNTVWTENSAVPNPSAPIPSSITLHTDGSLEYLTDQITIHSEIDQGILKTISTYDITTTDAVGNLQTLKTTPDGALDYVLRDPGGHLLSERKLDADGTFTYVQSRVIDGGTSRIWEISLEANGDVISRGYDRNAQGDSHLNDSIAISHADNSYSEQRFTNGVLVYEKIKTAAGEYTEITSSVTGERLSYLHVGTDGSEQRFSSLGAYSSHELNFDANGVGTDTSILYGVKIVTEYKADHVVISTTKNSTDDAPKIVTGTYDVSPFKAFVPPASLVTGGFRGVPGAFLRDGTWVIGTDGDTAILPPDDSIGWASPTSMTVSGNNVAFGTEDGDASYYFKDGQLSHAVVNGVEVALYDDGSLNVVGDYDYDADGSGGVRGPDGTTNFAPNIYSSPGSTALYNDLGHTENIVGWWGIIYGQRYYNEAGQLTGSRDASGVYSEIDNHSDGTWGQTTYSADGTRTTQQYSVDGTLTGQAWTDLLGRSGSTVYLPDGGRVETTSQANGSKIEIISDPSGKTTERDYDTLGHLFHEQWTDIYGRYGESTYAADGSHISVDHNYGTTVTQTFDSTGFLMQEKTEESWSTKITDYAPDGSSTGTITDIDGSHSEFQNSSNGASHSISFDPSGTKISEESTSSDGTFNNSYWSSEGVLVQQVSYDGSENVFRTYSPAGHLNYEQVSQNDGSTSSSEYDDAGLQLSHQWQNADGSTGATEHRPNGTLVEFAQNADYSAHVITTMANGFVAKAFLGTPADDLINADGNTNFVAGGAGNDMLHLSGAHNVIAYNQGDGRDNISAVAGSTNSLSLSGISSKDIALSHSGYNLVIQLGTNESITLVDWYQANATSHNFQVQILSDAGNVQQNSYAGHQFEQFDLVTLAAAFDRAHAQDPSVNNWNITSALQTAYLGGSNNTLVGGDVVAQYASTNHLEWYAQVVGTMQDPQFGITSQSMYGGSI